MIVNRRDIGMYFSIARMTKFNFLVDNCYMMLTFLVVYGCLQSMLMHKLLDRQ